MIERVVSDFAALHDIFAELAPEAERKVKIAVRNMIETEAYSYLKYHILKRAMSRIERGLTGSPDVAMDFISSAMIGEQISKSLDIKEKQPRTTHFRGINNEASS